ncbi:HNH endonuclease [Tenacibaculum ovolyticum]|uniref:HNH endonuclease n=1 Tax=Tenacibaculum ovolyticum TaxID=104270 RepID=UPI00041E48DB|nr:HNH endonuclease [Tenacibaculum ovolyticum]
MADPICRWRNPKIDTVVYLINLLPKNEMPKNEARKLVNEKFGGNFFHTPYQLACQLGLYHENDNSFFPKFKHTPTTGEVKAYLSNWIKHYCVPNPYTKKGFENLIPFSIHSILCEKLFNTQQIINWEEIEINLFGEKIGNFDILKNSINEHSNVIQIIDKIVSLKNDTTYLDLEHYTEVDISIDRNNKEYFFDLFPEPNKISKELNNWIDLQNFEINQDEANLLSEIDNTNNLSQTEKSQLVKSRIGQGVFRRNLISDCNFCPITGVNDSQFLIASHIKPWRNSNNNERLNKKNGLLLTPTYDKLFDKGYISFNENKNIIVSTKISQINCERLNIVDGLNIPLLPIDGREIFLEYHRDIVLKR